MTHLPALDLPESLNYVGVFLTLECNLNCSYCINDPEQAGRRSTIFPIESADSHGQLPPDLWAKALARIPVRNDLPITLQGGEPMLYAKGKGLGKILAQSDHRFDLLTNFALAPEQFIRSIEGHQDKLRREAPYPSIRVSWHRDEMNRTWKGKGFEELVERCAALANHGFRVSPKKAESDVGIYMVAHPDNTISDEMLKVCEGRVPFETKEFLGVHDGKLYGTYLYPYSTDLISRGFSSNTLSCECRTTELLVDPLGFVWGCHYFLYQGWECGGPRQEFVRLEAADFRFKKHEQEIFSGKPLRPIGHLLDPEFAMDDLLLFRPCHSYGRCIGCDTKVKNNRFQSYYDQGVAHTSVQIRNIRMPQPLLQGIENIGQASPFLHPDSQPTA